MLYQRIPNSTLLWLLLSIFVFTNCNKEPEITPKPEPELIFSFKASEFLSTESIENLVVISDENGELLGYEEFEAGDIFDVVGRPLEQDEQVNIHVINGSIIETYTNINPKGTWILDAPTHNPTHSIEVQVTNFPNPGTNQISVSDELAINGYTGSLMGSGFNSYEGNIKLTFAEDANNVVLSFTPENGVEDPSYILFADVENSDKYSIDCDTVRKEFDNIYVIQPASDRGIGTLALKGMDQSSFEENWNPGHLFGVVVNKGLGAPAKIGFNDGYDVYYSFYYEKGSENSFEKDYLKIGEKPELTDFTLPDKNFEIIESNPNSLSFTAHEDFDFQYSYYIINPGVDHGYSWWVYTPVPYNTASIWINIPEELTEYFPDPNDFKYVKSTFTDYLDSKDYGYYIQTELEEPIQGRKVQRLRVSN